MIAVVSFWDYDFAGLYPAFLTMNYTETLGSWVTWKTYLNTLKFTVIVWALTALHRLLGRLFPRLPYPHARRRR